MLIDLLSTSNYVSYNVNIANLLGLKMAVYLSELMNINNKAIHKRKTNSKYGFILDRDYITIRTTLTKEEQLDLDKTLVEFGVLELEDSYLNLDINKLASILMSDSKELVQDVKRLVKKPPKPTTVSSYYLSQRVYPKPQRYDPPLCILNRKGYDTLNRKGVPPIYRNFSQC